MAYSLLKSNCFSNESTDSLYYIIDLALNQSHNQLAANLSNELIAIIDCQTLQLIATINSDANLNPKIKYCALNCELISSTNESINIFDTRCDPKCAKQFQINLLSSPQTNFNLITCFDFNCDYRYFVAGNEKSSDNNVYLFFWDIRRPSAVLGAYSDSHTSDVNDVCFHHNQPNILVSGGSDQLVNVFDINNEEEDAIITTLTVESDLNSMSWSQSNCDQLVCLTRDESVEVWRVEDVSPKLRLTPSTSFYDYAIGVCENDVLAVGDNRCSAHLCPINDFYSDSTARKYSLTNGHNQIIRSICSANQCSVVYSGGEDGKICVWNLR